MPRIARRHSQSQFKHIIVQGINKEYIFKKNEYIERYKRIILEKLKNSNITILAYCIMNNHAHFLIHSEKSEYISKYMQRINTTYSQFYNRLNKRIGYVFRDRFYSQDILTQKQLFNCLKYIHNNPVKANICNSMKDYRYSSYNEFLGKKKIINNESIELLFGAIDEYEKNFNIIHEGNEFNDDFIDIKEKEISEFIIEIEKKYNKKINQLRREKDTLSNVIKEARRQTNVTLEELAKRLGMSKSTVGKYSKE